MPALTHGRVVNGFNLLPRTITNYQSKCSQNSNEQNKKTCYNKESCCGRPLQPANRRPRNSLIARVNPFDSGTKMASTVTTGRSFATKRAIARRVAKQIKCSDSGDIKTFGGCCNLPTVTHSQPRNAYPVKGNTYCCEKNSTVSYCPDGTVGGGTTTNTGGTTTNTGGTTTNTGGTTTNTGGTTTNTGGTTTNTGGPGTQPAPGGANPSGGNRLVSHSGR
jgi:hypothetical protein